MTDPLRQEKEAYAVLAGFPTGPFEMPVEPCPDLAAIIGRGASAGSRRKLQAGRWLVMENNLRPVTRAFASEGLQAWGYKGVDFAQTLYPDPCLRPMSDMDLILERERILDAAGIMRGAGWLEMSPGNPLLSSGVVSSILYSKKGILIDMHSHPSYFPSTVPGRLPHPSSLECIETPLGLLSAPDHYRLLLTILHMLRHRDRRSIWWVDAALLAWKMDARGWRGFTFLAARTGLSRRIAPLVSVLGSFPGVSIPEAVAHSLSSGPDRGMPLDVMRAGEGGPTVAAALTLRGWRKASFIAVVFMRLITGRSAAIPRPGHGGARDESGLC